MRVLIGGRWIFSYELIGGVWVGTHAQLEPQEVLAALSKLMGTNLL